MTKNEWIKALKSCKQVKRKVAQDAWVLAFGLGLRQGKHTRDIGDLIVKCATRLGKIDGLTAKDFKFIREATKSA
jgi:hypothetical protein